MKINTAIKAILIAAAVIGSVKLYEIGNQPGLSNEKPGFASSKLDIKPSPSPKPITPSPVPVPTLNPIPVPAPAPLAPKPPPQPPPVGAIIVGLGYPVGLIAFLLNLKN